MEATDLPKLSGEDAAYIFFTSGTTGPPKGTMLTHANVLWTTDSAFSRLGMSETETLVSYLPLSHVFERLVTTITPVTGSGHVEFYFVPEITMLPDALKHVRPTLFVAVPRVWEKFEARIKAEVGEAPAIRQKLFNFAADGGVASVAARWTIAECPASCADPRNPWQAPACEGTP